MLFMLIIFSLFLCYGYGIRYICCTILYKYKALSVNVVQFCTSAIPVKAVFSLKHGTILYKCTGAILYKPKSSYVLPFVAETIYVFLPHVLPVLHNLNKSEINKLLPVFAKLC